MDDYEYSIQEAKKEIKNSVMVYLSRKENGEYVLDAEKKNPFYVVGMPGIGKTEMAKQIAEELEIGFFATSLTHHTRNSILGLPVITSVGGYRSTEYTMPDIIAQIEKRCAAGETEGILLIDEFASMSEALVAPMLAFLQNKCIGDHRLPDGWIMILCSNPPEYNETAREFDAAVMDRVRYMKITYRLDDFLAYAEMVHLHRHIIDFIRHNPSSAYRCMGDGGDREIVTARSWENLSQCIYGYERLGEKISERLVYQFIKSRTIANEFYRYYILAGSALDHTDLDNIESGKDLHKYIALAEGFTFDKKWELVRLLRERLGQENAAVYKKSCGIDYMRKLWRRWSKAIPVGSECSFCMLGQECYGALKELVSSKQVTNDESEVVLPEFKQISDELISYFLWELENADIASFENQEVLKKMEKFINVHDESNNRIMSQNVVHIENAIRFVSGIESGALRESFIRELNKDRGILYTLTRNDCPEYTAAMGELLGVKDELLVS